MSWHDLLSAWNHAEDMVAVSPLPANPLTRDEAHRNVCITASVYIFHTVMDVIWEQGVWRMCILE